MLAKPLETMTQALDHVLPPHWKETLSTQLFALAKIPLLASLRPSVVDVSDERCEVRLPLTRWSKNHLGSMYFAALSAGADLAGGVIAMRLIQRSGQKISLIFKDFHAEFLRRAQGDVHFACEEGAAIQALVQQAIEQPERVNLPVHVTATVPSDDPAEPVAQFTLTLSLKRRSG